MRVYCAITTLNYARDLALSSGSIDASLQAHLCVGVTKIEVVGEKKGRARKKRRKYPKKTLQGVQ